MEPWLMFFYIVVIAVVIHGFFRGWYSANYKGIENQSKGLIDRL